MTPTGRTAPVGAISFQRVPEKGHVMTGIPTSTMIALWVAASCWAVSLVAYLCDGPPDLVFPLVSLGALTGVAEWIMRDQEK